MIISSINQVKTVVSLTIRTLGSALTSDIRTLQYYCSTFRGNIDIAESSAAYISVRVRHVFIVIQ